MAQKEVLKVPTIDFFSGELKPGTSQWESTKTQVFNALQEHGFFEAIYDKVPNEVREAMFDTSEQILPLNTKLWEYFEKPCPRYEGQIGRYPFYDNMLHSADLTLPEGVETFANIFWPNGNPDFCTLVESYYKPLLELDEMVKMMVLESFGLKDLRDEFFNLSNVYKLRLSQYYYKGQLPRHTDATFLSIIKQKQGGLKLCSKNGEWIQPSVSPNSYVILSGDAFMAWTNGRFTATPHEVTMEGEDSDRCSIQLFGFPKPGYLVDAPKQLVDEQHPKLFKPFDIVKYYQKLEATAEPGGAGVKPLSRSLSPYRS